MPTAEPSETTCLYHVAQNDDVERARGSGVYRNASLLRDGFIHACYLHQLGGVLERYYSEVDDVQLMLIDTDGLATPVVDENLIGGAELFPHLYGELAMESIIECVPFARHTQERQSMSHVGIERRGAVGYLTLDRPGALNAINLPMIQLLTAGLEAHEADELVQTIVIRSTDARAFCAGGDIKHVHSLVIDGNADAALALLAAEYRLNASIAACSKPYVALIDGIAMGGGLGLSIHGSHRIVTERVSMAMPECRIGFVPDVGSTWFLPRLPGRAGIWLGMTGMTIRAGEALAVGLATHGVRHAELPKLIEQLEAMQPGQSVDQVIDELTKRFDPDSKGDAEEATLQQRLDKVALWFASDDPQQTERTLISAASNDQDAATILQAWQAVSPHARTETAALLTRGARQDLQACLDAEWEAARSILAHPDFREGIRAVLIDKDGQPNWQS